MEEYPKLNSKTDIKSLSLSELENYIESIGDKKFIQNLDIDTDSNGQKYLKLNLDMQNISGTAENEYRYQECLSDFAKLKNFYIGDKTIADWFMFYNLIVHKNKFGSDRLTTLFGPFIDKVQEGSFIEDILQKVGDFDLSNIESISDRDLASPFVLVVL